METRQKHHRFDHSRPLKTAWLSLVAAVLLVAFGSSSGHGASFTASLEPEAITLGESAKLSLTFNDGEPRAMPTPPQIANLIFAYLGPSRQISYVNGKMSSTITYVFNVQARQAGTYTIPALKAEVEGRMLTTSPIRLQVAKPGAPPPGGAAAASQLAFIRLQLPKNEVYLGEVLVAELHLYVRQGVQGIQNFQLTDFPAEGFNVGKMVEGNRRQVQAGGAVYTVIPLIFPLTPTKAGPTKIGPVSATVVAQIPSRQRDPFFEQFGMRSMFNSVEDKPVPMACEASSVEILPLPATNVPPGFSGAVGSYTMTATVGPTNVAVGDPITVRVEVSGRGALDGVSLPPQPAWSNFKVYPATSKLETSDQLGLQGTKTFEQVIVAEKMELRSVPPFVFSYFDPAQKAYRTLRSAEVPLIVRPGGSLPSISLNNQKPSEEQATNSQDIVHIKPRLGNLASIGVPLVHRSWFLALQAVPVALLCGAYAWRRRVEQLANNPRLRRQRQVANTIRAGLEELRRAATENRSEDFYATMFRLLQERIGERLDLPASAITESVVEEQLRPRGAPEPLLAQVQELFQTCNAARYAPSTSGQGLTEMVPRVQNVLRELETISV
jgi:hypothetical protein